MTRHCVAAEVLPARNYIIDVYDQVKQQLRLQTDRLTAVREAIFPARKGGSAFVRGVFGGL